MTAETPIMETVRSPAGATIAYWRSGAGPPLVLVHGSISDRTAWVLVQPALEQRFTVYAVNRRGREGSSPPQPHTMDNEFEDVAAVVNAIGEPVHLLAHSLGAVCSLGATALTTNIRSLVLYEPPLLGTVRREMTGNVRTLLDDGRADDALAMFLAQAVHLTAEEIERMRQSPIWANIVVHVPNLVEEIGASEHYRFDASRYAGLDIPVLLLVGGDSPPRSREIIDALAQALPNAEARELPGERHLAQLSSPDLFTSEVLRFLDTV